VLDLLQQFSLLSAWHIETEVNVLGKVDVRRCFTWAKTSCQDFADIWAKGSRMDSDPIDFQCRKLVEDHSIDQNFGISTTVFYTPNLFSAFQPGKEDY
jgi:hypothetical protein